MIVCTSTHPVNLSTSVLTGDEWRLLNFLQKSNCATVAYCQCSNFGRGRHVLILIMSLFFYVTASQPLKSTAAKLFRHDAADSDNSLLLQGQSVSDLRHKGRGEASRRCCRAFTRRASQRKAGSRWNRMCIWKLRKISLHRRTQKEPIGEMIYEGRQCCGRMFWQRVHLSFRKKTRLNKRRNWKDW